MRLPGEEALSAQWGSPPAHRDREDRGVMRQVFVPCVTRC